MWEQDSMQIWFSGTLYDLALTSGGAKLYGHGQKDRTESIKTDGVLYTVTRASDGKTRYRIGFPKPDGGEWKKNDLVKFAFIINDADIKGERKGWMYYLTDIGNPVERSQSKEFILLDNESMEANENDIYNNSKINLSWSMNLKNWMAKTSGEMKITIDAKDNSVVFNTIFKPENKDRWMYPVLQLSESDRAAKYLFFEIKAVQDPPNRGFKNEQAMFYDAQNKRIGTIPYSVPQSDKFSKIILDLNKYGFDLSKAKDVRIGLNNKDAYEVTVWIRNLKFGDKDK
ncbi:MAG TPA: hypothetical protein DC049_11360 [Spirochaetia bacterium]|nr:hypothetical protein [Spirochaetia bacterium]